MVTIKNEGFREAGRKWLHISMGAFALLLRYLPWWAALICALAALANNLFILPRLTSKFYREDKKSDTGIILYPVAVFFVILLFPNRAYLAAALWGILAMGDGMATIVGIKFGKQKLPWNAKKSWIGSIAYLFAAWFAASLMIWWTIRPLSADQSPIFFYFVLPSILALLSAITESLPFGVNDNILVPLTGAFFAYVIITLYENFSLPEWELVWKQGVIGFLITLSFGTIAFVLNLVRFKGYIAGIIAGTLLFSLTDWRGFVLLLTFFIVATLFTKIGYAKKKAKGLAQEDSGKRGIKHILANLLLPIIVALFWLFSGYPPALALAFTAAIATALSDTLASEIGQMWGKRTFMITNLKRVPAGTDGAVSLEGTIAGLCGAFIIAGVAYLADFISGLELLLIAGFSGFAGNIVESYLNAWIKDKSAADNELMNFLNTLTGAGIAILIFNLLF